MLFNSLDFAVFMPLVFALYWAIPAARSDLRNALLLVASYVFYGWWDIRLLALIAFSTVVDFVVSIGLASSTDERRRRRLLWTSLAVNLGLLGFFKYYNFFLDQVNGAFSLLGMPLGSEHLDIILPVGISFYTFQTLSYTIDVYRGHMKPTRNLGNFALFVTFFPQLVAGPIERAPNLLPQFLERKNMDPALVVSGLKLMLWGFVKKVVVADRVSLVVDHIYATPDEMDWTTLVLGGSLFGIQAYCDFSGYSDIAIGAARVLGIRLMKNFRTPYLSASVAEFWTRWHISLNIWFRDYIYIPMGGSRVTKPRWYFNLAVVFLISGLWHGADWTYVLFGALHGLYLVMAITTKPYWQRINSAIGIERTPRLRHLLGVAGTFALVTFSWFLFRAQGIADAFTIIERVACFASGPVVIASLFSVFKPGILAITLLLGFAFLLFDHRLEAIVHGDHPLPRAMDILFHAALLVLLVLLGHYGEAAFMYFQF